MYEENYMHNYFFFVTKGMHTGSCCFFFFFILEGMEIDCIYQGYFHWFAEQQLTIVK